MLCTHAFLHVFAISHVSHASCSYVFGFPDSNYTCKQASRIIMSEPLNIKKTAPSNFFKIAGTGYIFIPAVPPRLLISSATQRIHDMLTFCIGESSSVFRTQFIKTFQVALESPFSLMLSAAIPPHAALCETSDKTYLLFLIGYLNLYNIRK